MTENQETELKKEVEKIDEGRPKTEEPKKDDIFSKTTEAYEKQKELNDRLEAEWKRSEDLRARSMLGGKSDGAEEEKTEQQKADEKAKELLSKFGY